MVSEIIQIVSLAITLLVASIAIFTVRRRPPWINDLIEDGSELLLKPNAEGVSLFDGLVDRGAKKFAESMRMSFLAGKSADARQLKMVENRVFNAIKDNSPEFKLLAKGLEELGLDDLLTPEYMPALAQVAQKYGIFNMIPGLMKGNSPGSGHGENVM